MQKQILKHLDALQHGQLALTLPDGSQHYFGDSSQALRADIDIHDQQLLEMVIAKGDIGFGEAYMLGLFSTQNLYNLLLFFLKNKHSITPLFYSNRLQLILSKLRQLFRRNNPQGSKKNIEFHYDLGNDFYQLWLDDTMSYSSGIYYASEDLKQSQLNKYQRIIEELASGETILEIGCGWGGFMQIAENQGKSVTGLTLSKQQKIYCDQLRQQQQLQRSMANLQDYRDEQQQYDNIVSIEMFEAVGVEYWHNYFSKIKQCLKKRGKAVIQTITINDCDYANYSKTSDFIREHIFPGGFLPSPEKFADCAKQHGLHVHNEFRFATSYKKTLLQWLANFSNAEQQLQQMQFDAGFMRKWQFYLAYCAAGFATEQTNVHQFTLVHA